MCRVEHGPRKAVLIPHTDVFGVCLETTVERANDLLFCLERAISGSHCTGIVFELFTCLRLRFANMEQHH